MSRAMTPSISATQGPVASTTAASPSSTRIASLDQFRGYTMAGMFLVNFIGGYAVVPALFKHHNTHCSYADTIMPQFFFAVGFAFRMSFLRRLSQDGTAAAYRHAIWRILGLILIGLVVYGTDLHVRSWDELKALGLWGTLSTAFIRESFQALVHIAVASLWILPVIAASARVRAIFLLASAILHASLSHLFYYDWALSRNVIDGGPMGFMSWAIPTLTGTLACDILQHRGPAGSIRPMLLWSLVLMLFGYALACLNVIGRPGSGEGLARWLVEPPFFPPSRPIDVWTMSQKAGAVSYMFFGAGFSLFLYAGFVWACDVRGWHAGVFRTLGRNALAGYLIHMLVAGAVHPFAPDDSPGWMVLSAFGVYFWFTYLILRYLERSRIFIKL